MQVWDVRLHAGKRVTLPLREGWNALLAVLGGTVQVNDQTVLRGPQVATLSDHGDAVLIEANNDAKLLLLSGEPIDEPVVGYGPFVMNSQAQIAQAVNDFNSGRFGQIAPA